MGYIIRGSFIDKTENNIYTVDIGKHTTSLYEEDTIIQIKDADEYDPEDKESIFFSESPVTITSDYSDTFEHVYSRQCSINLLCNFDIRPYIVAKNYTDIPVVITVNDTSTIFTGYVSPLSFNQPYAYEYNEFQLDCFDRLGTLEYIKFPNIPFIDTVEYNTPRYYINEILEELGFTTSDNTLVYNIEYDHTNDTKINPTIFVGESEDDWMNCKDVLNEIGKIYGCYFWQDGKICHIENLLLYDTTSYTDIEMDDYQSDDTNISIDEAYNTIKCTVDLSSIDETFVDPFDDDLLQPAQDQAERVLTELVYKNKDNDLDNVYNYKSFLEEAEGNPNEYIKPIRNWSLNNYDDENFEVYDNYAQVMQNSLFEFHNKYHTDYPNDTYLDFRTFTTDDDKASQATKTLRWLWEHPGRAAFISFGKTKNLVDHKNKTAVQLKDMKNNFIIQVNGNRTLASHYGNDDRDSTAGRLARRRAIFEAIGEMFDPQPVYTYDGDNNIIDVEYRNSLCGFNLGQSYNLTPNDRSTTNYLVISGKIRLNPIVAKTGPIERKNFDWDEYDPWIVYQRSRFNYIPMTTYWWREVGSHYSKAFAASAMLKGAVVEKDDDDDGSYYQYYGWNNVAEDPFMDIYWPWNADYNNPTDFTPYDPNTVPPGLAVPYLTPSHEMFKYKCSSYEMNGDEHAVDNISKMAILACELKIGDKYLIEDLSQLKLTNWGLSFKDYNKVYKWKTIEDCPWIDENDHTQGKQTWFTIGINPGIDDSLIGKDFDIQDTVDLRMNIDAKGLAIPIWYNDKLSGDLSFKILGPYNLVYTQAEKVSCWAKFWTGQATQYIGYPLLAYVENIILTDFKMEVYSSNGGKTARNTDNDLVYQSINNNLYTDDQDFECKFCSSLTTEQVNNLGVDYNLNNSSIVDLYNAPWYGMMDYEGVHISPSDPDKDNKKIKLEEARVSEQYNMWNRPRNVIETTIKLTDPDKAVDKTNYNFGYLKYENDDPQIYRTTVRTLNLKENTMTCTMKEYSDAQ